VSAELVVHAILAVDHTVNVEVVFILDVFTAVSANRKPFKKFLLFRFMG
jgi:hypothetical protein